MGLILDARGSTTLDLSRVGLLVTILKSPRLCSVKRARFRYTKNTNRFLHDDEKV
jgi:hypothetical protein